MTNAKSVVMSVLISVSNTVELNLDSTDLVKMLREAE